MARYRALRELQATTLGLVQSGQEFDWDGNIIGWHVAPLDEDAEAKIAERARILKERGEKGPGGVDDKPLPTSPFPKGVMKTAAGMSAPQIINQTMSVRPDVGEVQAPPRRRAPKADAA